MPRQQWNSPRFDKRGRVHPPFHIPLPYLDGSTIIVPRMTRQWPGREQT